MTTSPPVLRTHREVGEVWLVDGEHQCERLHTVEPHEAGRGAGVRLALGRGRVVTWRESGGVFVWEGREWVSPRGRGVLACSTGDGVLGLVAAVGVGLPSLKDGCGDNLRTSGCQHLQARTVLNKNEMLR